MHKITLFAVMSFLVVALSSCSTQEVIQTTQTTVKDTTLTSIIPAIHDTLNVVTNQDSTVEAIDVSPVTHDTVAVVHYYPVEKKVAIYVRPDTVRIPYHDTTQVIHNQITKETPLVLQIMGVGSVCLLLVLIIVFVSKFFK